MVKKKRKVIKNKCLYDAIRNYKKGPYKKDGEEEGSGSFYAFAKAIGKSPQSLRNMVYRNKKPIEYHLALTIEKDLYEDRGVFTVKEMMEWPK